MDQKVAIQIQHDENCYEMLKIAAESGFVYVSLGFGSSKCFHSEEWEKEIEKLKAALAENHLKCIMTHAPYYDLRISAEILDADMEAALLRCVKATSLLGAGIMALHPRTCDDYEKSYDCNIKSILPLVREAESCGCMVGIENLPIFPGWDKKFYSCFVEEQCELVDYFDSPNVCAVWDTGHANLMVRDQVEAIAMVGNRIKGTHIHENDRKSDAHLVPFGGSGASRPEAMDWKSILGALKKTGYDGFLTLEVDYNYNTEIRSFVKHMYESVNRLDELLNR